MLCRSIVGAGGRTTSTITGTATITDWTVLTAYSVGAYVQYNAVLFKCISAHSSTSLFDPSKWKKISDSNFSVAMALALG